MKHSIRNAAGRFDKQRFYKVVRKSYDQLVSAWHWNVLNYAKDEVTVAPTGTKLFIFSSLQDAISYAENTVGIAEVWEVEVTNPIESFVSAYSKNNLVRFWETWNRDPNEARRDYSSTGAIEGTYFADTVKLLKPVYYAK